MKYPTLPDCGRFPSFLKHFKGQLLAVMLTYCIKAKTLHHAFEKVMCQISRVAETSQRKDDLKRCAQNHGYIKHLHLVINIQVPSNLSIMASNILLYHILKEFVETDK